jgi:hypothetical protein
VIDPECEVAGAGRLLRQGVKMVRRQAARRSPKAAAPQGAARCTMKVSWHCSRRPLLQSPHWIRRAALHRRGSDSSIITPPTRGCTCPPLQHCADWKPRLRAPPYIASCDSLARVASVVR